MTSEQKLIDAMFEMVFTATSHNWFEGKNREEIAEWIRIQLKALGYTVVPMGASYGVLVDDKVIKI